MQGEFIELNQGLPFLIMKVIIYMLDATRGYHS